MTCNTYLLLTEFEGCTVNYRPCFFSFNLWLSAKHKGHELKMKKQGAVNCSKDQKNEVSKMFIISLGN